MKKYVVDEFADIFESHLVNGKIDYDIMYFIDRDNFYEINRSYLRHGYMSKEELRSKFMRAPVLKDKRDYDFAAANALYYLNNLKLGSVEWVENALKEADDSREDVWSWFVREKDIEREKENTPEEFRKFGFIYDKKHMEIR